MSETNTRLYELGFILVPTTPETEVPSKVESLKTLIKGVEGVVSSEGAPEYIDLAYTMERSVGSKKYKYSQGYFGWLKFEITPDALEALKKALDSDLDIVRYILLKTNVENTITFKKPKVEAKRGSELTEDDLVEDLTEEVEEDIAAHETLPDLMSEIESVEEVKEDEAQ